MNSASIVEPASKRLQGSSLSSTPVSLSKSLHYGGGGSHGRLQPRTRRRFRLRDVRNLQASLKSNDRIFTPDSSEVASTVFRPTTPFEARKKFIHAGKMVIILSRIYKAVFKSTKDSERLEPVTFTSLAQEYESANLKLSGLSFDKNLFKAKKEVGITPEVKNILSTPSYARTKEQLGTALIGLQTMRSFAEYPLHMQEKLIRVAWYELIPSRRVIIRQGHYAENFYFIISGSVVVSILTNNPDTGEASMRTAAVLRRGSSFGEIAILHHGLRTATVSSQGSVHLLAITREDFFDIFMRGQEPGQMPHHVSYLRQLNFMKYWPIEMLVEHPEMCLFHFYKRGQVIVKDSYKSDWLYIVKSGTCQVLIKLRAVKPHSHGGSDKSPLRAGRERTEDDAQSMRFDTRSQTEYDMKKRKRRSKTLSLPNIEPTKLSEPKKSHLRTSRSVSIHQLDLQSLADSPTFLTLSKPKTLSGSDDDEDDRTSINTQNTHDTLNHLTVNVAHHQVTADDQHVTDDMTAAADHVVSTGFLPDIEAMRKGVGPCQTSFSPSSFRSFPASPKRASRTRSHQHSRRDKKSKSVSPPAVRFEEVPDRRPASLPLDKDDLSVFIQVELLQPKDCFGLSSLDLDFGFDHAQSSVSLVSRGAECIMVKKDFFVKHASQAVKRNVRTLVYPYPTEEKLQQNLQSHSNWSHYKDETMHGLLVDKSKSKDLKT